MTDIKFEKTENKSYAYQKFKSLCDSQNVTPYQIAMSTEKENGKLGITTSAFSQWKYGEIELKLDKLTLIANFFGIPVTEFIE